MPHPGFLMILANVGASDEDEFNRWYDEEHMRERVEIPGFISAQRYVARGDAPLKYLALYETQSLSTFTSEPYREALAHQSDWSKRVLTIFRDPQRCVGERIAQAGQGTGRALSVLRLRPAEGEADALAALCASRLLPEWAGRRGIVSAGLLRSDPPLSRPVAEYPKDGRQLLSADDWFLLIGASDPAFLPPEPLADIPPTMLERAEPLGSFEILWDLHRSDLEADDRPGSGEPRAVPRTVDPQ